MQHADLELQPAVARYSSSRVDAFGCPPWAFFLTAWLLCKIAGNCSTKALFQRQELLDKCADKRHRLVSDRRTANTGRAGMYFTELLLHLVARVRI